MDCSHLTFVTNLASPVPNVVAKLHKGSELTIQYNGDDQPVLALTSSGETAGSIVGALLGFMTGCIENGYEYVAKVVEIDGGRCQLEVHPR